MMKSVWVTKRRRLRWIRAGGNNGADNVMESRTVIAAAALKTARRKYQKSGTGREAVGGARGAAAWAVGRDEKSE